jgi:hemerythrin-like domain-containing protein
MGMKKSNVKKMQSKAKPTEITALILEDHKPLKKLIKILKDDEESFAKRKKAFEQFAPLLTIHAKSEERALYTRMKEEDELRVEGLEGDTEHHIADQLANEIKAISDEDEFTAKAKVLAELVEHHIEEEEKEMLKEVRKEISLEERKEIGQDYLRLKEEVAAEEAPEVRAA